MLAFLGVPCLIIGIILIEKNKSRASKIWGIILVCFIPASIIIRFISSIVFWNINASNLQQRGEITTSNGGRNQGDQMVAGDGGRANPNSNN